MRPHLATAALATSLAALALGPAAASAATWTPPVSISAPHTFVDALSVVSSGDGTAVADWATQDGVGNGATTGVRAASLAPGAAAFGPERALARTTTTLVPYARRSVATLQRTALDPAGSRARLSVAFGSATGPAPGTAHSVAVDDVAFVPSLALGSDGTGLLAWIARASGSRRVVKVALRAPGGRFGAPSIIVGAGRANRVVAAVGPQGQRLVGLERGGRLLVRVREPGHGWGSVQDLGAIANGTDNRLAALVTTGGRMMIADVHRQLSEGGDAGPLFVDAWVRAVGASRFGARQRLDQADGLAASDPALVPGDGRGAVLAWAGSDPGAPPTPDGPSARVHVSVTGADGRFAAAQPLSAAAQPVKSVAAAGNGSAVVVSWVRIDATSDGDGQVLAALRPAGGLFGPPEEVSPHENAALTAPGFTRTPDNRPFVAWTARPGGEGPSVPTASILTFVRVAQRQP